MCAATVIPRKERLLTFCPQKHPPAKARSSVAWRRFASLKSLVCSDRLMTVTPKAALRCAGTLWRQ